MLSKKVHLVFLIFNDNLFAVNQPPIFSSSSFTVEKSVLGRYAHGVHFEGRKGGWVRRKYKNEEILSDVGSGGSECSRRLIRTEPALTYIVLHAV